VSGAERALEALTKLLQFAAELREDDEEKVWARVLDKLAVAFDAEAGTYYRFEPVKRHLLPKYAIGPNAGDLKGTPVDIRTGISGWVATHREPLVVPDAYQDERFLREVDSVTGFKTKTVLCMPLLDKHELTGVLQLFNKAAGPFDHADLELGLAASRAVLLSLRNLKLEATVEKVTARNASILENLTGGFVAVDTHGRMILCNPAARRILGLSGDPKLNLPIEQTLVHVPRLADVLLDTLASRKTVKRQELVWSSRGEDRTIGYSTILIQDTRGEMSGAGVTFQDITAVRKPA
jgi:PAS domain S-box-containing protein